MQGGEHSPSPGSCCFLLLGAGAGLPAPTPPESQFPVKTSVFSFHLPSESEAARCRRGPGCVWAGPGCTWLEAVATRGGFRR